MRVIATILLLLASASWPNRPAPHQVLAFYYGWYGNPQTSGAWVHWKDVDLTRHTIGSSSHFPVLGAYDSHDPYLIEKQVTEAVRASITGFIVSWWGKGDFHDQGMRPMLDAAARVGFRITIYYETAKPLVAPTVEATVQDLLYVLESYGKDPAWLKVNDKPVLFIYGRTIGQMKLDGWRDIVAEVNRRYPGGVVFIGDQISAAAARVFDGIHTYNPTGQTAHKFVSEIRAWAHETYPMWVRTAGEKIACLTVIPGYDDSAQGRPNPRPITDRYAGETYRTLWEEAVLARPDWILITSWNEWHEGTEIEPSLENGVRELQTTKEFALRFLR